MRSLLRLGHCVIRGHSWFAGHRPCPVGSALIGTAEKVGSWAADFIELLDAKDHVGAIEHFTKEMPPEYKAELQASSIWNMMIENAQSMRADAEALAWFHSAPLPALLGGLTMPVLSLVGESTFEVMQRGADAIVQAVPHAQKRVVPGAQHEWEVAPMVEELVNFVLQAVRIRYS